MPGLYLVIQPSGNKSWAVRYRNEGKPRKLTLEGFPSLATARKLAAAAIERPDHDPAVAKQAERKARLNGSETPKDTFPAVVDVYMRHYAEGRATRKKTKPKPRTISETRRLFDQLVAKDVWGERLVRDISKSDVIELLDGIVDGGAPVVANHTYAAISPFFAWAARRDIIATSPVVWSKVAEKARERHLTVDEIRLFWQATEGLGHPFKSIFQVLLLTGQRKSEVAEMLEGELDFGTSLWTIPSQRTKNRRVRTVPIADAVTEILRSTPRIGNNAGLVFTTNGATPPSGFAKPVKAVRAKMNKLAGRELPHWSLHDLRRTVSDAMNGELDFDPTSSRRS